MKQGHTTLQPMLGGVVVIAGKGESNGSDGGARMVAMDKRYYLEVDNISGGVVIKERGGGLTKERGGVI